MSGDMNRSLIHGLLTVQIENKKKGDNTLTALCGFLYIVMFAPLAHLADLLDNSAHKVVNLLQRGGGTKRAEELDTLTSRQ